MQANYKGTIVGWVCGFISAIILMKFLEIPNILKDTYYLNILGLSLDFIGAFSMALFIVFSDFFENHSNFMAKITILKGKEGPFQDFQRQMVVAGLILLSLGFILQLYSNWSQLK